MLSEEVLQRLDSIIPTDGLFSRPLPIEAELTYCGN